MPILKNVLAHGRPRDRQSVRMALHMPLVLEDRTAEGAADELDPRILGERSYDAGFMKDALRYYTLARQANPVDASIALKLGWTNNLLHDDRDGAPLVRHRAPQRRSRRSPPKPPRLDQSSPRHPNCFRTTVWLYPLYSSRWSDLFGYGQVKTEMRVEESCPSVPTRRCGCTAMSGAYSGGVKPQSLFRKRIHPRPRSRHQPVARRHRRGSRPAPPSAISTAITGATIEAAFLIAKTRGASLAAEHDGLVSRNHRRQRLHQPLRSRSDQLLAEQIRLHDGAWAVQTQSFWNNNMTFDCEAAVLGELSARPVRDFASICPHMPPAMNVTVSAVRGVYLRNQGNPRPSQFYTIFEQGSGMRLRNRTIPLLSCAFCDRHLRGGTFAVMGPQPGSWPADSLLRRPRPRAPRHRPISSSLPRHPASAGLAEAG